MQYYWQSYFSSNTRFAVCSFGCCSIIVMICLGDGHTPGFIVQVTEAYSSAAKYLKCTLAERGILSFA